ncbi:ornithine cyclodeaminase family protein [Zobellia galactanivorans]|uniref:ornithine cyclodeaminase family protein n=1 Tax=Zobellia galactanivorans (strain DSM 12802 / CCUG 47099 / CIP 106680 / NCIMB 13871 / Dsij) TaxID=63186 RepID=UPI001C075625|nr:ornithine cyclodeaminase family protein [Zobellia galactanivorans]MBU3024907.1 ornithine cyclodeaminase family protein [Zobellia galactanivorans]
MFIDNDQIEKLLPMSECIKVMQALFLLNAETDIVNPLRTTMPLHNDSHGIMGMMPAYIRPYEVMGIKVLSIFPDNYKKGLSSHQGVIHLYETRTGQLMTSLDADGITGIRTAAVSALATKHLAIPKAKTLCILGSGVQARKHIEAMLEIRDIEKITLWSLNKSSAERLAGDMEQYKEIDFKVCDTVREAAIDADIICTVTAATEPILENAYLKPHVHINAVGACTATTRELASEIINTSDVFVDNRVSAANEAGELLLPAKENGHDALDFVKADMSELLKDSSLYDASKKTVFKSLGIASEDLAAGLHCYTKLKG